MNSLDKIKDQIAAGRVDLAIKELLHYSEKTPYQKDVTLLSGQYQKARKAKNQNTIAENMLEIAGNRIDIAILDLAEEIHQYKIDQKKGASTKLVFTQGDKPNSKKWFVQWLPILLTLMTGVFAITGIIITSRNVKTLARQTSLNIDIPIGTVYPSLLPPEDFYKTVNQNPKSFDSKVSRWCYADGNQKIKGSKYGELMKKDTIDDFQGQFLRGLDTSGLIDLEGNFRKVGDLQSDLIRFPINTEIAFVMALVGEGSGEVDDGIITGRTKDEGSYSIYRGIRYDIGARRILGDDRRIMGQETRPKNIAVNFYIKIN